MYIGNTVFSISVHHNKTEFDTNKRVFCFLYVSRLILESEWFFVPPVAFCVTLLFRWSNRSWTQVPE